MRKTVHTRHWYVLLVEVEPFSQSETEMDVFNGQFNKLTINVVK